jgi:PTS system fructose-specific IIC component/PTS system nitrogen regulatory IIA component
LIHTLLYPFSQKNFTDERSIVMKNLLNVIFDPSAIKLNLDSKTKESAFAELVDLIADLNPECNRDELLAAIMERETKMSTGIGNGVAMPHAFSKGIGKTSGAIGISPNGIEYGAIDNKPVHVIFLLLTSVHEEEKSLCILNLVSKLAESEEIMLIKNAKNVQDIHSILSHI